MTDVPENKFFFSMLTAKRISCLIIVLLLFFSGVVIACHFHQDADTRSACAVCKSADDLDSGDLQQPLSLNAEEIQFLSAVYDLPLKLKEGAAFSIAMRAPPFHQLLPLPSVRKLV